MTFIQAAWLWLLPPTITVIILMHARRKRNVVVTSLVVWRGVHTTGSVAPSRRSLPWRDPLLWLQLLAAALLILAAARPVIGDNATTSWIVLLDASLSMNATDIEPNRFRAARNTVARRWGQRGHTDSVSLITVGARSRLVAFDWNTGLDFGHLVDDLVPSAGQADWVGAARRAASLAVRDRSARVAVITDDYGVQAAQQALTAVGFASQSVEVVSVGSTLANVGVRSVGAALRGGGPDQWAVSGTLVTSGFDTGDVVRVVASFRPPGTTTFLPWGAEDVAVASDGTGDFLIPLDLPGPGEVEVRGPRGDHLQVDDAAVLTMRTDPVQVAIVGEAHPALLRALAAIGGLKAYTSTEMPTPAESALFDLVIVTEDSRFAPATSTWWLGGLPSGPSPAAARSASRGSLSVGSHVLTADLDVSEFAVGVATPLELPRGATALLTSGEDVLAWARTTTTGRQVAFGFSLDDTDWLSQLSFPAFVATLVDWAAPRSWSHRASGCQVGATCDWPREAFAGSWQLLDPEGNLVTGLPMPTAVSDDALAAAVWLGPQLDAGFTPALAGSYTLVSDSGTLALPVAAVPLTDDPLGIESQVTERTRTASPALWRWLAIVAAAVLALESLLSLLKQRRVVRRRWRLPSALAVLAVVAVLLAALGVPVPGSGPTNTIAWVGDHDPRPAVGGNAPVEWISSAPATLAPQGGSEGSGTSDLEAVGMPDALELALAVPRGDGELRMVVSGGASDSLSITAAGDVALAASAAGVRIDVVEPQGNRVAASDVLSDRPTLRAVSLPERVMAGSHYSLLVEVAAPVGEEWRVEVELESITETVTEVPNLSLDSLQAATTGDATGIGSGSEEVELRAGGEGELVYRLLLLGEEDREPLAEASISVTVGPPPSVLMVASSEERGNGLEAALRTQGIAIDRTTPFRMPGTIERLAVYDSVVLVDVAAAELFPEYQALLEVYVREHGGGLTIVGGTSAFGPGGYFATPLEGISPLSSRITDEAPEVSMAFVLDRSGSMSGSVAASNRMDLAKAATIEAIGLLGERSMAAIVVFDTEARVALPLTSVADFDAISAALTTITPAGGTSIYPGLVEALRLMSTSPSATRHVVVMTDGLSQEADFAGVLQELKEAGITTTFVGIGDAADRRQLTTLATLSGGTLHMALDFRALPSLLAQEALMLAATPIEEGTISPRWEGGAAPDFLADVSEAVLPALEGYVKTTLKDEASVYAYAADDDPLLAGWRYGLGRVVAFTSDGDGRWSQAWLASESYGRLWSQVVRWVSERPIREPWSLRLGRRESALDVVVDLPPAAVGTPTTSLPSITFSRADGEPLGRRPLERLGQSRAAATFELDASQSGELGVTLAAAPELGHAQASTRLIRWPLPPGPPLRSDLVPLTVLAEATGGEVYSAASGLDLIDRGVSLRWLQLPVVWLLLALLAFLLSLAIRFGVVPRFAVGLKVRRAARTRTA